jgi:DNA-directed RNA polymerase subunit RPC12/RpoP
MKLKTCTCKHEITTKNAERVIRCKDEHFGGLYFNCPKCKSTAILRKKKPQPENTKGVA